jgi:hypothetical protein
MTPRRPHLLTAAPPAKALSLAGRVMAVASGMVVAAPAPATEAPADTHWDIQLATEWSRGHYGEAEATRLRNTSLVLRRRMGRLTAEMEAPWLRIDTEGQPASLPGSVGTGPNPAEGLGDVWLKMSWAMQAFDDDTPGIDLTLKVKTATGDLNKGLGSGGTDVALQWAGTASLSTSTRLFGHLGWRRTGDVKGYAPYRDPWYAELGVQAVQFNPVDFGAYYSTRQAIGRLGPLKELTAFCGWRHESRKMQVYVTRGFANASPQWAAGLTARQRF